ncbi:helix-turn-helix domain-containing protein [Actinomycetospora straminea]|uniref:Helix-turn-helix transcriptional regulator n=1 Tax=Actinomycetospora straminea TaxID=663607 RepID=A0ABP9E9Q4_9PSEU|nr:AraC family transcriptional regulator [Actinomycetospora straminea]MDD7932065.1 AraC family transcriptional regulator [Actinomycetospora straminea]
MTLAPTPGTMEPVAGYRERRVAPGVVLWSSDGAPGTILPDGCLDLIWDGRGLVVAGPDAAARFNDGGGRAHVGLRFSHGRGPGFLDVRADQLRDTTVDLDAVWSAAAARGLTDRVADDPAGALAALATATPPADGERFGARVFAALARGHDVAGLADELGTTSRTLHRRCLPLFGYGPQHLGRILRLQRALARARSGTPWAEVAAVEGFADQPHLAREVRSLAGTTPTGLLGG